jgi:hypothetical protein
MSTQVYRSFTLRTTGAKSRIETFDGRDHVVVPVVALVEGVIQAMNAPAPELVLYERFSVAPSGWNGRPIFLNHPMDGNTPVSGNSPSVLVRSMGKVFNASAANKRLNMEAWLDVTACKALGGKEEQLLDRVKANKAGATIEISTGAFIVLEDKAGSYNGTKYNGVWDIIIPDHLAILEDGATGACSAKMGCGIRSAVAYETSDDKLIPLYRTETRLNKDKEAKEPNKEQRSLRRRFAEFLGLMSPEEMGDSDLRETLYNALRVADPAFRYSGDITIVYPQRNLVVFQMYEPEGVCYYRRSYTLDATTGEATFGDAIVECERVTTYEPLPGQEDELTAALNNVVALAGARHSNKDQKMVQNLHDTAVTLGADCASMKASASGSPCGCGNHAASALEPATW